MAFQRLKEFHRIATRYEKTDTSYAAAIYLVAALLALNECLQALI
jgi:transposase